MSELVVLDSSVGVKWFKPESGHDEARGLLERHRDREVRIVVPVLFLHEVLSVAVRHGGPALGDGVWRALRLADLTTVGLDDGIVEAAFDLCGELRCTFYDALAPAIARRLDAPLYSADVRAHGAFPGTRLL
jgi:predicted nucleic acid-binding protein